MSLSFPPKKEKIISPWKEDENLGDLEPEGDENGTSKMNNFTKAAIFVFILTLLGAGYYYFITRPTGVNASVEFSKPDQIFSGLPFILKIPFSNNSDQILKNAKLSVYLPEKVYYMQGLRNQRVIENSIGDVGPGSVDTSHVFKLLVVGDSQSVKRIEAKLSYQLSGSSAQFESSNGIDLPVGQPAVDLSFEAPQNVFSGSTFDMTIKYKNNSGDDFTNDVILNMDYPSDFQFSRVSSRDLPQAEKSNPAADIASTRWNLGKLHKDASGSITITGVLIGADQSSMEFHGAVSGGGSDFNGQTIVISEQTANVSISSSPLSVSLLVNGSENYVARAGDELVYNIRYKNSSASTFENITLKVSLSGDMFDFSTVRTDAAFDPLKNTFTWMAANSSALARLSPEEEGTVSIDIKLKKDFFIRRVSDKNFSLKVKTEISSPTVPQGTQASKTISVASFENKIAGKVDIQAKAFWRDATSGILNSGPYPPRVNKPTQYTIHWILANYVTDASGVEVSAFLQSGARWTGKVKSNTASSSPSYDPTSGKVIWNIGDIIANKGVISNPVEAVFQVEVTPAANQLNQYITFLGDTSVKWADNFIDAQYTGSEQALTTALQDDTTIGSFVSRGVQQ